jgi:hypothetical protein
MKARLTLRRSSRIELPFHSILTPSFLAISPRQENVFVGRRAAVRSVVPACSRVLATLHHHNCRQRHIFHRARSTHSNGWEAYTVTTPDTAPSPNVTALDRRPGSTPRMWSYCSVRKVYVENRTAELVPCFRICRIVSVCPAFRGKTDSRQILALCTGPGPLPQLR